MYTIYSLLKLQFLVACGYSILQHIKIDKESKFVKFDMSFSGKGIWFQYIDNNVCDSSYIVLDP